MPAPNPGESSSGTYLADTRDFPVLQHAVQDGVAKLGGRLDTIVANAGIGMYGTGLDTTEDAWETVVGIDLKGCWLTAKAGLPAMIAAGNGGSLIFTSSILGLKGHSGAFAYTAAKHGLVGVMRAFAHELVEHRIRSNSIHPTNVQTPMIDNDDLRRAFRPDLENPTREDTDPIFAAMNLWNHLPWVQSVDISNAVLWLASDEARYITGITLPVDLGATAR